MTAPIHIISLGAGVQSSCLALMAAAGGVGPMPAAAVFSDTGDEPAGVYRWLDWLEKQLPFPVYRVSIGKLSEAATTIRTSQKSGNTYTRIGLPVFTTEKTLARPIIDWEPEEQSPTEKAEGLFPEERPVYGEPVTVIKKGMGMRGCTRTFKIEPVRRKLRELSAGRPVVQWIGISTDEAHRMKPSRDKWCENRWPLIEVNMTRRACLQWMADAGWPTPPRSACVYCPYHSDKEWLRLKTDEPTEFQRAVDFERELQAAHSQATSLRTVPWLHRSRKPLGDVAFNPEAKEPDLFGNECEGMCGV